MIRVTSRMAASTYPNQRSSQLKPYSVGRVPLPAWASHACSSTMSSRKRRRMSGPPTMQPTHSRAKRAPDERCRLVARLERRVDGRHFVSLHEPWEILLLEPALVRELVGWHDGREPEAEIAGRCGVRAPRLDLRHVRKLGGLAAEGLRREAGGCR